MFLDLCDNDDQKYTKLSTRMIRKLDGNRNSWWHSSSSGSGDIGGSEISSEWERSGIVWIAHLCYGALQSALVWWIAGLLTSVHWIAGLPTYMHLTVVNSRAQERSRCQQIMDQSVIIVGNTPIHRDTQTNRRPERLFRQPIQVLQ